MNLTYVWKLLRFSKKNNSELNLNDVIVQTYWSKTGTNEDGISGTFMGATPFYMNQVDSDNFISYGDLTEEIILSWIKSSTSGNTYIDEVIDDMIDQQINPDITEESFPWNVGVATT